MKRLFLYLFTTSFVISAMAQNKILLYPLGVTESNGITTAERFERADFVTDISEPYMYSFLADDNIANGTAVLICPGGGYGGVAIIKEGQEIAKWFNQLGVSAFVLYYRMPNGHHDIPLKDAQTAMDIIRKQAKEWNIDKNKIGIIGFSAGGHLASTVGTHFKTKAQRPAFMILAYPVISMDSTITNSGSRKNLLGNKPKPELVKQYSNELRVTKNTATTFMIHAKDDKSVNIANSINFRNALATKNVPVELYIYEVGGHGFGMQKSGIPADNWNEELKKWLLTNKFVNIK